MSWIDAALELANELAKIYNKKLDTKYKDKAMKLRDEIWELEQEPFESRDQAKIDNLLREQSDLIKLFRKEIEGLSK